MKVSMKVITTTQYNRPQYTRRMLDSLIKCDKINEYTLIASVDPSDCTDVIWSMLADARKHLDVHIHVNDSKLGCNTNTMMALYRGFRHEYQVLHVEDDILLSRDALVQYEKWEESDFAFSFSLYSKIRREDYRPVMINDILYRPGFIPWGFGIREWAFAEALENRCFNVAQPYVSWDIAMHMMCQYKQHDNRFTYLSRAQNIGAEYGTHVPSVEFHKENQHLEFWAGELDEPETNQ